MKKITLFVSFSGGRTSAYMSKYLIDNCGHKYNFIFVFANTGLEDEATLKFVDDCDKNWGLNLIWLEANVNQIKNTPIEFNIVDFDSADRVGRIFYDLCKKHGVPNSSRPFCTQYLKTSVINAYKASLGLKRKHLTAIGIRADEFDRMNYAQIEAGETIYPLISMKHTTKDDVLSFFKDNSFDLELNENYGNCVACFKKSERHLLTIAKHRPEAFDIMKKIEKDFGHIAAKKDDPFKLYRGNKSALDIIATSKKPFREFDSEQKELQIGFDFEIGFEFEIDPLDEIDGCGDACGV